MRPLFILLSLFLALVLCACDQASVHHAESSDDTEADGSEADGTDADGTEPQDAGLDTDDGTDEGDSADGVADGDTTIEVPVGCWTQAPPLGEVVAWVRPDGDDDGPGSESTPFQTLETASAAVRARLQQGDVPAGGLSVVLYGGTYALADSLVLTAEDSGQEGAPITWRVAPGESAVLSGGQVLPASGFAPLAFDDPLWDRIPETSRSSVRALHLPTHGVSDYGTLQRRGLKGTGESALELYLDGMPQHLARWPNVGQTDPSAPEADAVVKGDIFGAGTTFAYVGTQAVDNADDGFANYHGQAAGSDWYLYHCTWEWGGDTHRYWFVSATDPRVQGACWPSDQTAWAGSGTDPMPVLSTTWGAAAEPISPSNRVEDYAQDGFLRIAEVFSDTAFRLPGSRWETWASEAQPWFQGLFYYYWGDDTLAGTVAPDGRVDLSEIPTYGTAARQPFFVFNLPEELDEAGEMYLDRDSGTLYWWPPTGWDSGRIVASVLSAPLLSVDGASHLRFEGLDFEAVRSDAITARDVDDVVFSRCRVSGTGDAGITFVGSNGGVECSEIAQTGGEGVLLAGGHRPDLTPSGLFVQDTEIHHFGRWDRTYDPGVKMRGVGNRIVHNHIHHAPHTAILFTGNNHTIAYNDIGHVVLESNDAGAIYTGRDWGYRGTVIELNFIHDIESVFDGVVGVYLDDAVSGITVRHNIFAHISGLATQSGGGRDNLHHHNVMAHIERGAHSTDRRAQTSNNTWSNGVPDSWNLLGRLHVSVESYEYGATLKYQQEPWASAYPALAAIPDDFALVQGTHWQDPEGSTFQDNLVWDANTLFVVGTWGGEGALDAYADISGNVENVDPLFRDEANGDYGLQPSSPAFSIPGFLEIPFDDIGPR